MRRRRRGYTVVELMMALAVFATGVTGVIAMQRATVTANRLAKNITVASGIADAWLGQLAADATRWQTDLAGTTWLKTVDVANMNGAWQLPAYDAPRDFGPGFDPLGAPMGIGGDFCAHIRLTWFYPNGGVGGGIQGNGLIRTEVRVFWPRDGVTRVANDCTSGVPATITAVSAAIASGDYNVVTQAGAVRQPAGIW
jgi:prepilin-type N-terminal cleavage/methylation domain-containing protein